jgi:hypothetical protein
MQSQLTLGFQVRLVVTAALNLVLFLWGLERMGKYSTEEAQALAHFWIAGTSFLSLGALWPILRRGAPLARFAGGFLCLIPIWMLCLVASSYFRRF